MLDRLNPIGIRVRIPPSPPHKLHNILIIFNNSDLQLFSPHFSPRKATSGQRIPLSERVAASIRIQRSKTSERKTQDQAESRTSSRPPEAGLKAEGPLRGGSELPPSGLRNVPLALLGAVLIPSLHPKKRRASRCFAKRG